MKYKLIAILLVVLALNLTACTHSAPVSNNTVADVQPTEQQVETTPKETETPTLTETAEQAADTVTQGQESQAPSKEPAVETEEAEEPSEQAQESGTPATNEEDAVEENTPSTPVETSGTETYVKDLEDMVSRYSAMISDETMPYGLKFIINSNIQDKISDYEELLQGDSLSEADRVLIQQYLDELARLYPIYAEMMFELNEGDEADSEDAETDFPPAEGPSTPPAAPTALTDEEVQKVVNDYLDNFKTTVDMSDWSDEAIGKLDENIEIIKNDPPKSVIRAIDGYQGGYNTKENLEAQIWAFLYKGGYGSQEITVQ